MSEPTREPQRRRPGTAPRVVRSTQRAWPFERTRYLVWMSITTVRADRRRVTHQSAQLDIWKARGQRRLQVEHERIPRTKDGTTFRDLVRYYSLDYTVDVRFVCCRPVGGVGSQSPSYFASGPMSDTARCGLGIDLEEIRVRDGVPCTAQRNGLHRVLPGMHSFSCRIREWTRSTN